MPVYTTGRGNGSGVGGLPADLLQKLATWPASGTGQRLVHRHIMTLAVSLRHYVSEAEAIQLIRDSPMPRPPAKREIEDSVAKAYGSSAAATSGAAAAGSSSSTGAGGGAAAAAGRPANPRPLPAPIQNGFTVFMETCFLIGDGVAISDTNVKPNGTRPPGYGDVHPRERWFERLNGRDISRIYPSKEGLYVRINPMALGGSTDNDVTVFRHTLVEFDLDKNGNRIPKEIQYGWIMDSGFPISAIVDSGGKSIQALIRVDAPDRDEYKRRVDIVLAWFVSCDGFDDGNWNPSRYCRCPGVERNLYDKDGKLVSVGHQALLAVNVGAADWEAWQKTQQPVLSAWEKGFSIGHRSSKEIEGMNILSPEPLIGDWLRVGDLGFIFAARGLGKSWFAMDMAHAIAQHDEKPVDFGPWKVHRWDRVLYLDGEMAPGDIKTRDAALGIPTESLVYVNHEILYEETGLVMNLADREFQKGVISFCQKQAFKVLFLDNLSTLTSGIDENIAIDWERIQSWLLELRRLHITVIFIHHAGRNNQMRGHSKREDPCSWLIRLDATNDASHHKGARFFVRFTKWRGANEMPRTYLWSYTPVGYDICVEFKEAGQIWVFRQLVENGLDTCSEIAAEMDVSNGYVSQLAKTAERQGWLLIKGRKYFIKQKP